VDNRGPLVVVGMNEVEAAATHQLVPTPSEDLFQRGVDFDVDGQTVLPHPGQTRRERAADGRVQFPVSHLVAEHHEQVDVVDIGNVVEMEGQGASRLGCQSNLRVCGAHRACPLPRVDDRHAVGWDDHVERGPGDQHLLSAQRDLGRHGHEQPVGSDAAT
jgi:hypothetical protein